MFASLSDDFANISITCTAPSKTFNLAGLQVSNIFIPNETLRFKFKKAVDAAGYSQVNVMGLEACQAAYEYGEEWLTQLKEYLKDNIAFVREFIQKRLPTSRKTVHTLLAGHFFKKFKSRIGILCYYKFRIDILFL